MEDLSIFNETQLTQELSTFSSTMMENNRVDMLVISWEGHGVCSITQETLPPYLETVGGHPMGQVSLTKQASLLVRAT